VGIDGLPKPSNDAESPYVALASHKGLEETLYSACGANSFEHAAMTMERVAEILAYDPSARREAYDFLTTGGKGYEQNREAADGVREELAWLIIDVLTGGSAGTPT
jgi:hypothetical protein